MGAKAAAWNQEALSRAFAGGAQGSYAGSPRRPGSEGVASTIAPETSSFAPWAHSAAGSAVPQSAVGGLRTPSPAPLRPAPSPSFEPLTMLPGRQPAAVEPLTMLPGRQPAGVVQFSPRSQPDGSHRADAVSVAGYSAEGLLQGNFAAPPSTGPAYGQWDMNPSTGPAYGQWDMNAEAEKALPWGVPGGPVQMETVARTSLGAYGYGGQPHEHAGFGRM
jgi:hypothetical protein